ncbi:MAG TPA: sulfatase [Pirellulales bacterium]|nr:sulfatase [Pirellulales bacterium]
MRRLLFLCWATFAAAHPALADAPRGPNVVFILADDLGFTDLACYGSQYYESPNIDRLAAQGLRCTDGYSCGPNCQPTRAALLSGQYGPRTGIYTVGSIERFDWRSRSLRPVDNVTELPLNRVTVAQALQRAGYATGLFGKWHLGEDDTHHPLRRGFDEAFTTEGRHFDFVTNPPVDYPPGAYLADFLTDRAIDFLRRHRNEPFFLYLPHFGVHGPHQAKPELIAHFKAKAPGGGHHDPTYAAMIASVDESVGRVVAALDELGIAENTLVIFSSDNGGVGGYEREGIFGNSITDNSPLRGGKGMLYEGGIRVPYVFRWTGRIPAGGTSAFPINSVDLYPTLLELTGAKQPEGQVLDGESYAERLLGKDGPKDATRDAIYWHFPGYLGAARGTWRTAPAGAIRAGDWKLLEFFEDGHVELYNLCEDPGEKHDLASAEPDRARALHAQLVVWRQEIGAPLPTSR